MSKQVSHNISVALGLRLPFYAGAGLTYNANDPDEHKHKPVAMSADRTVVLAADNAIPIGSIKVVEPDDGHSVKLDIETGPIVRFRKATATTFAAADFGKGVLADATGGVKPQGAATAAFGRVTSVEGDMVYVLTY